MIFRKIFQAVVDDNRSSDDFGMREFLASEKNLHDEIFMYSAFSILIYHKFDYQESTHKKDEEEDGKEVEVFIYDALNLRAEFSKQSSHCEKAEGTAECRSNKKEEKIELEDSRSNGEDLIGNRSETG